MIDMHNLENLLSLDDKELKARITSAATAAGADEKKISGALSDINFLKSVVRGLSEEQINKLLNSFGEENAKKIADAINNSDRR